MYNQLIKIQKAVLCGSKLSGSQIELNKFDNIEMLDSVDTENMHVVPYIIAHPGIIAPLVVSVMGEARAQKFNFTQRAVLAAYNKLSLRTKAFDNHDPSKELSDTRRPTPGVVVGKAFLNRNGVKNTVAFVGFKDKATADKFPNISLETSGFIADAQGNVFDVEPITGLGLLIESIRPAFDNAKQVLAAHHYQTGAVLCNYADPNQGQAGIAGLMPLHQVSQQRVTPAMARDAAVREEWQPSSVFDTDQMVGQLDIEDGKLTFDGGDKRLKRVLQSKLNGKRIVEADEYTALKEKADKYDKIEKPFADLRNDKFQSDFKSRLDSAIETRGVKDEKLIKFLKADAFIAKVEYSEDVDKTIDAYMQAQTDLFKQTHGDSGDNDGDSKTDDTQGGGSGESDMLEDL